MESNTIKPHQTAAVRPPRGNITGIKKAPKWSGKRKFIIKIEVTFDSSVSSCNQRSLLMILDI